MINIKKLKVVLRDYQQKAVNEVFTSKDDVVLRAPTGSGKTVMACELIRMMVDNGQRVMFVAPRINLIEQTRDMFVKYGIPKKYISILCGSLGDKDYDSSKMIQISSSQTLNRRNVDFSDVDTVIVDEAHISANWAHKVKGDVRLIGFTATPYPTFMKDTYDGIVKTQTMCELTDSGSLSPVNIYDVGRLVMKGCKTSGSPDGGRDYSSKYSISMMNSFGVVDRALKQYQDLNCPSHTLVFCVNQSHGKVVKEKFIANGIKAELLIATTPKKERDQMFKRYEKGQIEVLISVSIITMGFDSIVSNILFLRPTMSPTVLIQSLGRATRNHPLYPTKSFYDFTGSILKLGLPADLENVSFLNKGFQSKTGKSKIKPCDVCNSVKAKKVSSETVKDNGIATVIKSSTCVDCGNTTTKESHYPMDQDGNVLNKLSSKGNYVVTVSVNGLEESISVVNHKIVSGSKEARMTHYIGQLYRYAKLNGYKPGWAYFISKLVFKEPVDLKQYSKSHQYLTRELYERLQAIGKARSKETFTSFKNRMDYVKI